MDKIKENLFYVVPGCIGAALLIFFVLFVYPMWGEAGAKRTSVNRIKNTLPQDGMFIPSQADIKAWKNRDAKYEKVYNQILKYYRKTDTGLESWFGAAKIHSLIVSWIS